MIARLLIGVAVCLTLAAGSAPRPVLAHGPALKGVEIDRPVRISGTTGDCPCVAHWYTVGFQQGTAAVSGRLQHCGEGTGMACSVEVDLFRGGNLLKKTQAACYAAQTNCNASLHITYRVSRPGPYYVYVHGAGMQTIYFTLQVRGSIYPLHCRKYC